jgi:hypothetical protein
MSDRTIQRYLARYLDPRAVETDISACAAAVYAQAVVVPLFDEATGSLGQVFRQLEGSNTLVIAVVNVPDNANPQARRRTAHLLQHGPAATALDVLAVDCVSRPLSAKSGVGHARKIGTDIALMLHTRGIIRSPWLYQTDADAVLPANYLSTTLPLRGAVVFGHQHHSGDALLQRAADLYDLHMAYYVAGLRAAGSSFAFPTLGSTLAIHAASYAAVRGYPQRNAAEDFYLLNKVAKVHGVTCQPEVSIHIKARLSERVPFGTGPALATIVASLKDNPSGYAYNSYHPDSFAELASALALMELLTPGHAAQALAVWQAAAADNAAVLLESIGFGRVRETILHQYAQPEQRRRALHEWFDAGKTLRFVHQARRFHNDQSLLVTYQTLPESLQTHLLVPPDIVTRLAKP